MGQSLDVDRRSLHDVSYREFAEQYLAENRPLIVTDVDQGFSCVQGGPEALISRYGQLQAPVLDCNTLCDYSGTTVSRNVAEYLREQQTHTPSAATLYLKDWHLQREGQLLQGTTVYSPPILFSDDWLNAYCDEQDSSDYRFVYIGGEQTWTPLHHDVLCSYSWSVNISGSKQWVSSRNLAHDSDLVCHRQADLSLVCDLCCFQILYPPSETAKLCGRNGDLAVDVRTDKFDTAAFPC